MSEPTANVAAGVSGILTIVLIVVGFGVLIGESPGLGESPADVATFIDDATNRLWVGGYVEFLAFFFYLVFLVRLWAIARRAEGGSGWIAMTALAAGILSVALGVGIAFTAGAAAVYRGKRGLDPEVAAALIDMRTFGFFLSNAVIGLFLLALAWILVRTDGFPRWVAWSAVVIGIVLIATVPSGSIAAISIGNVLFMVWLLATSIVLIVRRRRLTAV